MRPLLHTLYARVPDLDATAFFVPDDYATGREGVVARAQFPRLRVVEPGAYLRFAAGGKLADGPTHIDRVQYLGGDLMHAARIRSRFGARASTYKFTRRRYRDIFDPIFAVDAPNRLQLIDWDAPTERIRVVGNLAIDGALQEAAGDFGEPAAGLDLTDGVVILPGSRKGEVANGIPFFLGVAYRLAARLPGVKIAFGLSPFTDLDEVERALRDGGIAAGYGMRGAIAQRGELLGIVPNASDDFFAITHATMRAARSARLAITLPGTKAIELAALGVPALVCVPMNAPEVAVINGPLQYVDRIPLVGRTLKASAVMRVAKRFTYFAQPNIDAGRPLLPELRGTLTPGRVAAVAAERYADTAWREATSQELRALYAAQAGAAERIATALVAAG